MIRSNRRRFLFILAAVFLVVLFCLGLSEICFRVILPYYPAFSRIGSKLYPTHGIIDPNYYMFDPETGYAFLPDINDPLHAVHTDPYGFRITRRPYDPSRESIVFVGDSTVFGWAAADQDTFCYRFSEDPALKEYNVLNMGVPAYSLGHVVAALKYKVPRFNPKIVFVEILWPWLPFSQYHTLQAWKEIDFEFYRRVIPPKREFDLKAVTETFPWYVPRSCLMIRDWIQHFPYRKQVRENLVRPGVRDFNISPEGEALLAMDHVILLKEAVAPLIEQGVQVFFYIHPFQYVLFMPQYENLGKTGRDVLEAQLAAIDFGGYLKRSFKGTPLYIDGSHLNPLGHEVASRFFLETLREKQLLRDRSR